MNHYEKCEFAMPNNIQIC